jgi:hypothetical protein
MKYVKQGEAKTLTLTVTDEYGAAVDVSEATLHLGIKLNKNQADYAIEKQDGDFNKTAGAQGIVTVFLDALDTDLAPGIYVGELEATWDASPDIIEKTADFELKVIKSVITT